MSVPTPGSPAVPTASDYRFGRIRVRPAPRELLLDGVPVALGVRAFDVLLVLIEQRGRVVSKNELMERAWPHVVVGENNLHVQISTLRELRSGGDRHRARPRLPVRGRRHAAAARPQRPRRPPRGSRATCSAAPRLFGRERERAELRARCRGSAWSADGPGGIGKTRLAQAVADAGVTTPTACGWSSWRP